MRTIRQRIVHTILFEIGAIAVAAPVIAAVTGAALAQAGAVTIALSGIATLCNYLWTLLFDRMVPTRRRGLGVRAAQAIGLEVVISVFAIPMFYVFTAATLTQAVALDLGGAGFFIAYSMSYNWLFDRIMIRLGAAAA